MTVFKVGCLLTVNGDPYPALPGFFSQLWDGDVVAARVYGNSREEVNARVAALNVKPPERVPFGWKVAGTRDLYTGEYAEIDAKAEARRIGGTCCAFPLFT